MDNTVKKVRVTEAQVLLRWSLLPNLAKEKRRRHLVFKQREPRVDKKQICGRGRGGGKINGKSSHFREELIQIQPFTKILRLCCVLEKECFKDD